jgi:hypothetical protein
MVKKKSHQQAKSRREEIYSYLSAKSLKEPHFMVKILTSSENLFFHYVLEIEHQGLQSENSESPIQEDVQMSKSKVKTTLM